jgi:regulator of ribonuclease activity A
MNLSTADLSDRYPQALVADLLFRNFGGLDFFYGPIVTVKVFEDNAMVRTLLEEAGHGRVLVVDGGGSLRCALVGGNLAMLGVSNGWSGILVNGCIRDSKEIRKTALGVKAIGTHPRKSERGLHTGHRNRPVAFAGVTFKDEQWLYSDDDGIVVSEVALHEAS